MVGRGRAACVSLRASSVFQGSVRRCAVLGPWQGADFLRPRSMRCGGEDLALEREPGLPRWLILQLFVAVRSG